MTHIVIHQNEQLRNQYLLELTAKLFGRKVTEISELIKNPDFHLLKEEGSIGIEKVKLLQKDMIFQPFQEKVQIAVIENAQNLTHEAQNALLKTLEEQPGDTEYVLMVDNHKNLLDTILSRGVKHYVKGEKVSHENIQKPQILDMDIVGRFTEIERVVKEEEIDILLSSLLHYFRRELRRAIESGNDKEIREKIEAVDLAKKRLKANGNKKLVLENMSLNI